ncbi:MAG TPA: hypothetical protein VEX62_09005, partial [Candidatus Limnocylindrales bacterium]|nr:hypothetical protein [Candidatus Limnocylindrales bacterium]
MPTLIDETGLVTNCNQPDYVIAEDLVGAISVHNVTDNDLYVMWASTSCDVENVFTFRESADGYELIAVPSSTCQEAGPASSSIQISFSRPIHAESIEASLIEAANTPPTVRPTSSEPVIECSDPVAEIGAVVVDVTGVVNSCTTVEGEGLAEDQSPRVTNPGGDTDLLQIDWSGTPCDAAVGWTLSDAYPNQDRAFPVWLLTMGPRPDGQHLGAELDDGTRLCRQPLVHHTIVLDLKTDIPANNQVELADPTSHWPPGVVNHECGDDIATFVDRTGIVRGCSIATDRGVPSTDATIGEREALVSLAWPVMLDNACQPLPSVVTAWGPVAGLTDEDYV